MTSASEFLCGVIEGFYGQPWSAKQRKHLFVCMQAMHLNTYMYAPKDDSKHRCNWRQLYTNKEAEKLRSLIQAANAAGIVFIYALSPGLDMVYSRETHALQRKLAQVHRLGCRAFALLFDDINPRLRGPDRAAFGTPAEAQCAVANAAFEHLGRPVPFLLCPTEYCASRARPSVADSPYLAALGSGPRPEIGVLWTGPRVVSKAITAASIQEVAGVLRRRPVIWDNLHANDYDPKRVFLGPYCGRGSDLVPLLDGVLTNPNCEFEANYIAMSTLAQWYRSSNSSSVYNPEAALEQAVRDWLPAFCSCSGAGGSDTLRLSGATADDEAQNMDKADCRAKDGDSCVPIDEVDEDEDAGEDEEDSDACQVPLSADELLTVCHLFYLPHRHGDRAVRLLDEFHWLRVCASDTGALARQDWLRRAVAFDREVARVRLVRGKLHLLSNRRLALDLLPYVSDVCHVLGLLNEYLHNRRELGSPGNAVKEHLQQSVPRGGVAAELQRLLPPEAARSLLLHRVFAVRRCSDVDGRGVLAELAACTEPQSPADKLLERLCADDALVRSQGDADADPNGAAPARHGFVLEDAFGVCAFACVMPCRDTPGCGPALEFLSGQCPLLQFAVSAGRCDLSLDPEARPLRRLLDRCLAALDDDGVASVRCLLPVASASASGTEAPARSLVDSLCDCLGFRRLRCPEASQRGWELLAKSLV